MNMSVPFVMTKSGINLYLDGKMESVANDHPNYQAIVDTLKSVIAPTVPKNPVG